MNPLLLVLLALYSLPALIAFQHGHHNASSILVFNLLLGWTFIGWVIALAMAFSQVSRRKSVPDDRDALCERAFFRWVSRWTEGTVAEHSVVRSPFSFWFCWLG